ASIGIAVRRWVSYHGFALNVAPDLRFFDLINPCGLTGIHMTSVAERMGDRAPSLAEAREVVAGPAPAAPGRARGEWGQTRRAERNRARGLAVGESLKTTRGGRPPLVRGRRKGRPC